MNGNNKNLFLVGLLVVIVGLGGIWSFIKYRSATNSPVADLGLVTYVNAQGQEWSIPKGEYEFKISSAERYPKFITGFIDPLDVKVGDIQKMLVAINSDQPLKRVWAEIETDNSVRILDLTQESSAPMSSNDYKNETYLVDENGVLVLNDSNNQDLLAKLISTASAQNGVIQYRYEGEWKVEDTHTRTYQTRFVAEDSTGRLDSITLAWSDPVCSFDTNGNLQSSCTATGGVEGFDASSATDTTIGNNFTINLTNAVLAFNPGTSVVLNSTGKVVLNSGGKIQKTYQCLVDSDSDGFTTNVARATSTQSNCSNLGASYKRLYTISSTTIDCYDSNANAKPGQTSWFSSHRGDGSFDYNCSGTQDFRYPYSISDTGSSCYVYDWTSFNEIANLYKQDYVGGDITDLTYSPAGGIPTSYLHAGDNVFLTGSGAGSCGSTYGTVYPYSDLGAAEYCCSDIGLNANCEPNYDGYIAMSGGISGTGFVQQCR